MTGFDTVGNVARDTFVKADPATQSGMLFDMLAFIYDEAGSHSKRIKKLENRKKFDTGIAAASGIIGGFAAVLSKKLW